MGSINAGLAHDIGHDLATVSCLLAGIRRDTTLHTNHRRRLELVEREVARIQTLVGQDGPAGTEEIALRDLVTEVVEPFALAGGAEVVAHPLTDVPVTVDAQLLWRLVANLVGNAMRAAGPGGRVRVGVLGNPHPGIEVADDGPGFGAGPPGIAGLGLANSEQLAVRCGAELEITSPAYGGTVARVRFPSAYDGCAAVPDPRAPEGVRR